MDPTEFFRSVGDVWLVWLASLAALSYVFYRACQRISWRRFRRMLSTEEEGASYVLPYVLTFPIYMLLVCLLIQTTLILIVKLGTYYAAYAAARSAIVWRSIEPNGDLKRGWVFHDDGDGSVSGSDDLNITGEELANQKAYHAAVLAMTPFASSNQRHLQAISQPLLRIHLPILDDPTAGRLFDAYHRMAEDNVSQDHFRQWRLRSEYQLRRSSGAKVMAPQNTSGIITTPDAIAPDSYALNKYKFATLATQVDLKMTPNDWNADFTATVSYEMPMVIPGAGRILGQNPASRFFSRIISTTVTLPAETPQSANRHLGIDYDPEAAY